MLIYFFIFISKIIENTLSTLRLIVVTSGKKKLGALLNGLVALCWIFVTGIVIVDVQKDPLKIVFFCLGSIVGSYLGSVIEEKIAIGTNMLICIINKKIEQILKSKLSNYKIIITNEKNKNLSILFIIVKRKEINKISKLIKKIDNNSIIISEKIKNISDIA